MKYTEELQRIIEQFNIKDENRLFLTIKNQYLDDMREGIKNVEYREDTEFFRRKIFIKGANGKPSQEMKPLKYILFQGGYEPDSPRLLIELKGWTVNGKKFPVDLSTTGFDVEDYDICLLLGKIIYDSQNGRLFRDLPSRKKISSPKPKSDKVVKPRKKKKTLQDKKEIRSESIVKKYGKTSGRFTYVQSKKGKE